MADIINILLSPQVLGPSAAVLSGLITYFGKQCVDHWLERRKLRMEHGYRIIEEHTKRLHEYVEKYYLKMFSNLQFIENQLRSVDELSKSSSPIEEELELSFFGFARLMKLEEEWFRKTSGILLLKDPTGERVITALTAKVEEQFLGKDGYLNMEDDAQIRDEIDLDERLSVFKSKMTRGKLKKIADKYKAAVQQNISSLQSVVRSLRCLRTLFDFELNACYEAWYGKKPMKPCFELEEWSLLEQTLEELQKQGIISPKDRKRYRQRIQK